MTETDNHSKHYKYGLVATSTLASILVLAMGIGVVSNTPLAILGGGVADEATFGGSFTLTHQDSNGNIIAQQTHENLVPNEGLECIVDLVWSTQALCTGEATDGFSWIDIGTGAVAPADGDTTITPIALCGRVQDGTITTNTGTTGQRTVTVDVTFNDTDCEGSAIAETAIFDASTAGNMLARALVSPTITLNTGDTLTVTYDIVLNNT